MKNHLTILRQYADNGRKTELDNSYDGVVHKETGKLGVTYRSRKQDGTLHGFGLESVKTVIEKYNGQLEIDSNGTSFFVCFMLRIKKNWNPCSLQIGFMKSSKVCWSRRTMCKNARRRLMHHPEIDEVEHHFSSFWATKKVKEWLRTAGIAEN